MILRGKVNIYIYMMREAARRPAYIDNASLVIARLADYATSLENEEASEGRELGTEEIYND
jgi:hypothetical protein